MNGAAALCRYEGIATGLVTSLKFRRHRDAVGAIGAALAIMGGPWLDDATVCWVPAEPTNAASRGFDQGQLLANAAARAASRRLGRRIPVQGLLLREPSTTVGKGRRLGGSASEAVGQTGRTRAERLVGPSMRSARAAPQRVVVVDDVITTGTSLARAAAALRAAGALEVYALCVAATPDEVVSFPDRSRKSQDGSPARRPLPPHR